jgi:hypothetical protein
MCVMFQRMQSLRPHLMRHNRLACVSMPVPAPLKKPCAEEAFCNIPNTRREVHFSVLWWIGRPDLRGVDLPGVAIGKMRPVAP